MKNILLILFLGFFSSSYEQTTSKPWEILYTNENIKAKLNAVSFSGKNTAYAVGEYGTILRIIINDKPNFGIYRVYTNVSDELNDISFTDTNHGFIAGNNGIILATKDGGTSWIQLILDEEFSVMDFVSIDCQDTRIIYVVTRSGKLLQTTDGGENWRIINYGSDKKCSKVSVTKDGSVYINCRSTESERSFIYRRNPDEELFKKIIEGNDIYYITSMNFSDKRNGVFLTSNQDVIMFKDGGNNFENISLPQNIMKANVISKNSEGRNFIFGNQNFIYSFLDIEFSELQNWNAHKTTDQSERNILDADFGKFGSTSGFAVGENGVICATWNSGERWEKVNPIEYEETETLTFRSINFISNDTLVGVGYISKKDTLQGALLISTDKGKTWRKGTDGNVKLFSSISFAPNKIGIAVADNGYILRSVNGTNWHPVDFKSNNFLRDVKHINGNTWLAVGDNSTIIKSINGGNSWQYLKLNENITLLGIAAINKDKIMICGRSNNDKKGVVYSTDNGGLSWVLSFKSNSSDLFTDLYFLDDNIGFTAGDKGIIMKTIDGGKTWNETFTSTESFINQIIFKNNNTGYAVCDNGEVLQTTDGGKMWMNMSTKVRSNINGVCISPDGKTILAAGANGTILSH